MGKSLKLSDLIVYKLSHELGKKVWSLVSTWKYYDRETLGKQFVRAADSVSLNISEGYGRYYYRQKKMFGFYSRGSLYETIECLKKANERNLITSEEYLELRLLIMELLPILNGYIRSINSRINSEKK